MNFLNKCSAAIVGEVLCKLIYVFERFIILSIIVFWAGYLKLLEWMKQDTTVAKIIAGLVTGSICLLILVACIFEPSILLIIATAFLVSQILEDGFKGILTGWNYGFNGVFTHCIDRYEVLIVTIEKILVDEKRDMNPQGNHVDLMEENRADFFQQFQQAPAQNQFDLNTLYLSDTEFSFLYNNQHIPLNPEEIEWLESDLDENTRRRMTAYKNLWERLEISGECVIIGNKPERTDAVLLVKLLVPGDIPIPNSTQIFDRTSLTTWVNVHNTHPITREVIFPSPEANRGTGDYRYVVHPYYPPSGSTSTSGISQELSEHAGFLRAHLARYQQPSPPENERNRMIAARLKTFGGSASAIQEPASEPEPGKGSSMSMS